MTARMVNKGEIVWIGLISGLVGIVATLGTGFMSWGGLEQRVRTIERARETKVERDAMREQLTEFRAEARQRFDRLERLFLERRRQ